jgi:hypothetical protein
MIPADEAASQPDVLLHSLAVLQPVILPALEIADARVVVEVGVEGGRMTEHLREYAHRVGGRCIGVDPSPSDDIRARYGDDAHLSLVEGRSPAALRELEPADAYLLDGDHNYWTVREELGVVAEAAGRDRHPVAFVHDVGWPAGRRDQYYDPDALPADAVHPFTFNQGVRRGSTETVDGGFRGGGAFAWAIEEGGPRNGVRTAVDDFLTDHSRFTGAVIPSVFGLAVVWPGDAPFGDALRAHLSAWIDNPLFVTLERNRIDLYDRVLRLQDLLAEAGDAGPRLRAENARLRVRVGELEARLEGIRVEAEAMGYLRSLRAVDMVERAARRVRGGSTLRTRLAGVRDVAGPGSGEEDT